LVLNIFQKSLPTKASTSVRTALLLIAWIYHNAEKLRNRYLFPVEK